MSANAVLWNLIYVGILSFYVDSASSALLGLSIPLYNRIIFRFLKLCQQIKRKGIVFQKLSRWHYSDLISIRSKTSEIAALEE